MNLIMHGMGSCLFYKRYDVSEAKIEDDMKYLKKKLIFSYLSNSSMGFLPKRHQCWIRMDLITLDSSLSQGHLTP